VGLFLLSKGESFKKTPLMRNIQITLHAST
jgi:hypothetical protein